MPSLILVVGATGTVGSEVVKQLTDRGGRVRVMTRDPAKAAKFGKAVEIVEADLGKPETLGPAFAGVEKAFVLSNGPGIALEGNALAAAKAAGVRHVVNVTAQELDFPELAAAPLGQAHLSIERALVESGLAWTILRPSWFASNLLIPFLMDLRAGETVLPAGDGKEAPIDPRDIAAVAIKTLTTPGHEGKTYVITGPELLSQTDMMARASAILGRPLKHVDISEAEALTRWLGMGVPREFADSLIGHFKAMKAGRAHVTSAVAEITGRPPRRFEDWVHDHRAALNAARSI
jgi:uncharacterized protein YbjT (DUF2867 family)